MSSPGIIKPTRILYFTITALSKFCIRSVQCTGVLIDNILLEFHSPLQCVQLGGEPCGGGFKILHTGSGQLEARFCLLYLLVDGLDVSGEIIRFQRQRYDKIAERFAHQGSPTFHKIPLTK